MLMVSVGKMNRLRKSDSKAQALDMKYDGGFEYGGSDIRYDDDDDDVRKNGYDDGEKVRSKER